jgi:hypothetical protein
LKRLALPGHNTKNPVITPKTKGQPLGLAAIGLSLGKCLDFGILDHSTARLSWSVSIRGFASPDYSGFAFSVIPAIAIKLYLSL